MRRLPGTDLSVYPLCLGGNVFGWSADRDTSFAVLDAYVAAGGNMVDTADAYAHWLGHGGGESETIIGEWFASGRSRDSLLIATKVGKKPGLNNLRAETIVTACEESLRRLHTDHIDLYYAHQDHDDPMEESLEAFDSLVRSGKVRHVAASNYSAPRLAAALDLSAARGLASYVALQPEYNLLERNEYEQDLLPVLQERTIGTLPYFSLARGYLTGKYRAGGPPVDSVRAAGVSGYVGERGERVLAAVEQVAANHAVPIPSVALAWLLTRPMVVAPIASARTVEQLGDLLPMATLDLTPDELEMLETASA